MPNRKIKMASFQLKSEFEPAGDQPAAIDFLSQSILADTLHQVLLGVTGSGKTFTMANIITAVGKPTLVLAPNKTLAAQLYNEFKQLFPDNAVEYFVSYYDYYQPEAYIPASDTYIQKDSSINEMIDKLRHSATRSVLSRRDVIVVASVSCIYGIGSPEDYDAMRVDIKRGQDVPRDRLLRELVAMQYDRKEMDFHRGTFRVRGDRVDIFPACEEERAIRIEFFGDHVDELAEIDPLKGSKLRNLKRATVYPASHYVTRATTLKKAISSIKIELKQQLINLREQDKLLEVQRLEERTQFDLEMMQELGYCNGIENYSRHLTGRSPGEPPPTLLDYFPDDFLLCIDECHIAIPQIRAMYKGDRSRKKTLVQYGFRMPSALDNRPLKFEEFEARRFQALYVSATPAAYEMEKAKSAVVEQIARPTGLIDPMIEVRRAGFQVDDLYSEITLRCKRNERVLVTTLTKRMAEDLSEYYADLGIGVRYLHADISTLERMQIINELRMGTIDVLIGINLLREGLDIPEVSLVAILDADKEGFLRSRRSLIQTCGRASRNVHGRVIMYADKVTKSMQETIDETLRRREIQLDYNKVHGVVPQTITKKISPDIGFGMGDQPAGSDDKIAESESVYKSLEQLDETIERFEAKMQKAAEALEFEQAAELRDRIKALRELAVF